MTLKQNHDTFKQVPNRLAINLAYYKIALKNLHKDGITPSCKHKLKGILQKDKGGDMHKPKAKILNNPELRAHVGMQTQDKNETITKNDVENTCDKNKDNGIHMEHLFNDDGDGVISSNTAYSNSIHTLGDDTDSKMRMTVPIGKTPSTTMVT